MEIVLVKLVGIGYVCDKVCSSLQKYNVNIVYAVQGGVTYHIVFNSIS